ncbi:MAG: polysaccharide biosynthesis/export family protein [Janthinobacterium lividum]
MKKIYLNNTYLILLLALFFLSACSYKQQHVLFKTNVATAPPVYNQNTASTGNSAYKIGPDDLLQIRNLQNISYIVNEQMAATGSAAQAPAYQVEEDGTVALPVIGRITVSGLTRYEAARKIESLYKEKLLKDPIIDLKIINLKVTLLGEVRTQGNYLLLKDKTSLVDIIGEAGGLTDKANEKNIQIIRGDKAHPQIIMADLNDIRTLANPALNLQNNDIIYIAQNNRTVRNDATQNLSGIIQPVLVLLNTALVIFTLTRK